MAEDGDGTGDGTGDATSRESEALQEALAAEHAAVWGYGVVGAALSPAGRDPVVAGETAHRDVRDQVAALLADRGVDPGPAAAAYTLPFPVLSEVDAAALAVVLEDGVAAAWVLVLDRADDVPIRELGVGVLSAAEVRAVSWRAAAGQTPATRALPGLPPA